MVVSMGLLGQGWDDPQSAAIMALAGGLLRKDFGGGLLGANQAFMAQKQALSDAEDRKLKRGLLEAQIDETKAQAAQRRLAGEQAAQSEALMQQIFGGGGIGAPQVSPGAFSPAADGMGPTMPPSMAAQGMPGSRLAGLSFDQLAMLKARGKDFVELHKYANDPQKLEGGSTYVNRVTGKREYMPKLPEGMAPDGGGMYNFVPNYTNAVSGFEGQKAEAQERVKALYGSAGRLNLRDMPDGTKAPVSEIDENTGLRRVLGLPPGNRPPRSVGGDPPAGAGVVPPESQTQRVAVLEKSLAQAQALANSPALNPADRERAQRDVSDLQRELGMTRPGLGYGKTTAQEIADAAAKEAAIKTAGANVERDTANKADAKRYGQLTVGIERAIDLLKAGPTESGAGAAFDTAAGFFGQSTRGADLGSQLKTLSGWLTANVPRMEGPQSNVDVANYAIQAGMVGDNTKPISQRLAAAEEVKRLQQKYAAINGYGPKAANPAAPEQTPAKQVINELPKSAPKGQRVRDTATNTVLVFNGLSWVKE
jgi:hypothetical protein